MSKIKKKDVLQQEQFYSVNPAVQYTGAHTITREEYYRRTENAERPFTDEGMNLRTGTLKKQKH